MELRQMMLEVWRTYAPGPDPALERQARVQTDINRAQMAEDFLGLIKSVLGLTSHVDQLHCSDQE